MGIVDVGDVFIGYVLEADKDKRFVVLSIGMDREKVFVLLINSELNEFQKRNAHIRNQKLPLEHAGRGYLTHDSYLCCERVHAYPLRHIETLVKSGKIKLKGKMTGADLVAAKQIIYQTGAYDAYSMADFGIFAEDFE
jgi:hypothetical protein